MELDNLVKGLLTELHRISSSDAVTGGVREAGTARVLPLSRITIGFATGNSDTKGEATQKQVAGDAGFAAGGVMGAVQVQPKAFVVVDDDGNAHMLALKSGKQSVLRRGLELAATAAGKLVDEAGSSNPELGSGDE